MIPDPLDLFLAVSLLLLAWQLLRAKDIFVSVVLFIVFGLLMALAWVQLAAPDIALVEAAIGSGLTGALFLGVLGRMEALEKKDGSDRKSRYARFFMPAALLLGASLCWAAAHVGIAQRGLEEEVLSSLPLSGVTNAVTAVILNFRGYDTLLEIGVLFLTLLAALSAYRCVPYQPSKLVAGDSRVLGFFLHFMAPLMLVTACYLLWAGGSAPGGAFQAGAILSGLGILLLLGGANIHVAIGSAWQRTVIAAGLLAFLAVGTAVMASGRAFLQYPPQAAKYLILGIESLCALSIAWIFINLFFLCTGIAKNASESEGEA